MYGLEKEEVLRALNQDILINNNRTYLSNNLSPHDSYRQKLKIYQKDLKELNSKDD